MRKVMRRMTQLYANALAAAGDADRRLRRVVLTTKGVAKLREARRGWKQAQARFDDLFGETAATKLRVTLLRTASDERLATLAD
jgi:DNA-binding MarR family transcriptional regulator